MHILASLTLAEGFFIALVILIALWFLISLVIIYLDFKSIHRLRAQGQVIFWHKRPNILSSIGMIFVMTSGLINAATDIKILPTSLFLYVIVAILLVLGITIAVYAASIAFRQLRSHR